MITVYVLLAVLALGGLLQTVVEVAAEKNSTLVLPFPVELLRFLERATPAEAAAAASPEAITDPSDAPTHGLVAGLQRDGASEKLTPSGKPTATGTTTTPMPASMAPAVAGR
jgi:hypothetical protein